jgi:glycosyltransferase involved in cell wall biosynthesis
LRKRPVSGILAAQGGQGLKVALVHDWGNQVGGAEGVLLALKETFPDAPVYMSMYAPALMPEVWRTWGIRTSFMDRLPLVKRHHQLFLPLYPLAFEQFDFSEFDLVISNKSGFCHGIITPPETLHIDYCLTPTRYVWDYGSYARREGIGRLANFLLQPLLTCLRVWDRLAADRVDHFVAISGEVQRRIRKYYGRDSTIIYPPVETNRFAPVDGHDDYFLVVSRLVPYKRIDLAVQAFNRLGLPLKIAGSGRDRTALEQMAGRTIEFLGRVPDSELGRLLQRCRAFVFPGHEDFGIAPLQANAAGRPVIAYRAGGALDTVVEGKTGLLFDEQTPESLMAAVRTLDDMIFEPEVIRQHALRFDKTVFQRELMRFVEIKLAEHKKALR